MQSPRVERKLAAILSADVQGYSRLMDEDEEGTLHTLQAHREVTDTLIHQHRGRIVGTAGDSVLAEFASVIDTVRCAVEIQQQLRVRNAELPEHRRMEFRIGINLGDVMVDGEQIYGDGVNVAARLQSLADAGGIFISGTVYDQVENKLPLAYEYLGEQAVKNITRPVRVWRVRIEVPSPRGALINQGPTEGQGEGATGRARIVTPPHPNLPPQGGKEPEKRRVGTAHRNWVVAAVASLLLIAGTFLTVRYLSRPPVSPQSSTLVTQEAQPHALPLPDKPSLVVLPFANMSEDPKQEYFSDGITEDLTSDLSKISSLFVISRNSAFTYKGKAVNVQEISKEFGVRYVLEGSVRKADSQVRITAQLIDATTGYHLWTERYDRPMKDIFVLQDEIVQQIVANLRVEVPEAELERVQRIPTENLNAYDFNLRGMEALTRALLETNKEARAQAQQMFEKAIELDPQYAEAYAGLSFTYSLDWLYLWNPTPQVLEHWSELARKAIALDPALPAPHRSLAWGYVYKRQHDQAIAEAERAVALDPNEADGYRALGNMLGWAGRPEEAIGLIEKAMRLNPRNRFPYLLNLGISYRWVGQYEKAIPPLRQASSLIPNALPVHWNLAVCYAELGRQEEAQAEAAEMLRVYPQFSVEAFRPFLPFKDPAMLERELAGLRKAWLK
ncbi:MAG TPA: adenylate/guanylate cyclase domain-containing protein [Candidatus Binatia bacterium]|nr:adenylate/guanylate cyclase domain-containing protein [Candidatus Binatia bacterium]